MLSVPAWLKTADAPPNLTALGNRRLVGHSYLRNIGVIATDEALL
jgi:hypothetical protein